MHLYEGLQVEVDVRQRALLIIVNPDDRPLVDSLVATQTVPVIVPGVADQLKCSTLAARSMPK